VKRPRAVLSGIWIRKQARHILLTDMLSILAAALHLGLVVGLRELLLLAGQLRPGPIARIVQLNVSAKFLMQQ
jgi:hypothetical protein